MDRSKRLYRLRSEGQAFATGLTDDTLDLAVPSCPGWSVRDLAHHMGRVWNWAGAATRSTERPPRPQLRYPDDAAGICDGLLAELALLLDALEGDAAQPAWSFAPGHGTLGFWQRRQLVETAIHRWDAVSAVRCPRPLDADIALDALDEMTDVLIPLRTAELATPPVNAIRATTAADDSGWLWGSGTPVAEVAGAASDLALLAWGRLPVDAPSLAWSGAVEAGRAFVAAKLTP